MARQKWIVPVVALAMALGGPACADKIAVDGFEVDFDDAQQRPRTAVQLAFVEAYLGAVNSGSVPRIDAVTHPASLTCGTSPNVQSFLADRIKNDVSKPIGDHAKIVIVPYVEQLVLPLGLKTFATFPVQPTHILGISIEDRQRNAEGTLVRVTGRTILRAAIEAGDRMLLVRHCMTPAGEELLIERMAAAKRDDQKQ